MATSRPISSRRPLADPTEDITSNKNLIPKTVAEAKMRLKYVRHATPNHAHAHTHTHIHKCAHGQMDKNGLRGLHRQDLGATSCVTKPLQRRGAMPARLDAVRCQQRAAGAARLPGCPSTHPAARSVSRQEVIGYIGFTATLLAFGVATLIVYLITYTVPYTEVREDMGSSIWTPIPSRQPHDTALWERPPLSRDSLSIPSHILSLESLSQHTVRLGGRTVPHCQLARVEQADTRRNLPRQCPHPSMHAGRRPP